MNETSGSTVYDSTAGGHNGTASGAAITTGLYGNARSFNGTSDYVNFGSSSALSPSSFTLSAWIYPTNVSNERIIFFRGTDGGDSTKTTYCMAVVNGQLYCVLCLASGASGPWGGVGSISVNNWYHVAFTYNGSSGYGYGYVNGVKYLLPGSNPTAGTPRTNSWDFKLGTYYNHAYGNEYFKGIIDEACVSNVARSETEIMQAAQR
jgi:hypothetical protein